MRPFVRVTVDASAFAREGAEIEVCMIPMNQDGSPEGESCAPVGWPTVSVTVHNDYPKVWGYSVKQIVAGSAFIHPEGGHGTHRMTCRPHTTEIVLGSD